MHTNPDTITYSISTHSPITLCIFWRYVTMYTYTYAYYSAYEKCEWDLDLFSLIC